MGRKKGDSPHLPERPGGCFAQMGPVPFFNRSPYPGLPTDFEGQIEHAVLEILDSVKIDERSTVRNGLVE